MSDKSRQPITARAGHDIIQEVLEIMKDAVCLVTTSKEKTVERKAADAKRQLVARILRIPVGEQPDVEIPTSHYSQGVIVEDWQLPHVLTYLNHDVMGIHSIHRKNYLSPQFIVVPHAEKRERLCKFMDLLEETSD